MRIAHISNLHLSTLFKKSNIGKTKKLIKFALEKGYDHLVITGDISDNSEAKDFVILRKILQNFNLLNSEKTSVVIGNHDIFGGVQSALDVVNFPSKCLRTDYDNKGRCFAAHFKELFNGGYFPLKDYSFPYAKIFHEFLIVGINTVDHYSRLKNPFASNGKVYKEQRTGIEKIFEDDRYKDKRKIVLAHHHFYRKQETASSASSIWNSLESYTLKLKGKKNLFKLFSGGNVELVLHGLSDEIRDYRRKGIRFLNAGGSCDNLYTDNSAIIFIDINERIDAVIHSLDLTGKVKAETYYSTEYLPSLAG